MGTKSVHKLSSPAEPVLSIIGIASHENDYRISWALNNALGFNFVKTDNLKSFHKKFNEFQEFSMYLSFSDDLSPVYKLISNRCDNGFLLEELRTIDYLLIIENSDKLTNINDVVLQLKSIPFIATAFILNPSSVKSINRLK
jgi:hypothetical protein